MNEKDIKTFQKVVKYAAMALAVLLTVSIFGAVFTGLLAITGISGTVGEMKDFAFGGEILSMDIEIAAAELSITDGEAFSVRSNLENLNVNVENGTLKIKESSLFGFKNYNGALLEVVIPENFSFDKIDIETGAGVVDIESLNAQTLELELGAGKVNIKSLSATRSANIDGGAGKLTVGGGILTNLDFDMGVGETEICAEIKGRADVDMGIGKATLTLIGGEESYEINFSKGLGSISYNGKNVENNTTVGNGLTYIDIDGGIGSLIVETEK